MTNFIEEMMQTAGVEPTKIIKEFPTYEAASKFGFKLTGTPKLNKGKFEIGSYTNNVDVFQVHWSEYPTFTAEKQLEIIKLISNKLGTPGIDIIFFDGTYNFYTGLRFGSSHKDFAQALAQLTTELMRAGELDKEKVKEILQ